MTYSKIFFYLCLSFILGIYFKADNKACLFLFIFSLMVVSVLWGNKKALVFSLCIISFIFGSLRINSININSEPETKGVVKENPSIGEKSLSFKLNNILVVTSLYPRYNYGDELVVSGKMEKAEPYLKRKGILFVAVFPDIKILSSKNGNLFLGSLFYIKEKIKEKTSLFIPFPEQGFLEALFFGDENNIPKITKKS